MADQNEKIEALELSVNGEEVRTNRFVATIMGNVLIGMVKSLADVAEAEEIQLKVKISRKDA